MHGNGAFFCDSNEQKKNLFLVCQQNLWIIYIFNAMTG
jgi:hypothetical protein